jgi:hypothetical protein
LETEGANNRFVASTFTKNKEALRLREKKLNRKKAEFAEAKALLKRQQQDLARRKARVAEREAQVAGRDTRVGELIISLGKQFDAVRAQSTPSAVQTIMTTPAQQPLEASPAHHQKSRVPRQVPRQVPRPKTSRAETAASPDRRAATSFGDHPTSPLRPGVKHEAQSPLRPGPPSRRTPALHGYSNIINIGSRRQGPLEMEYFVRRHGVPPRWEPASKVRKEAPELVSDYDDKHPEA